MIVDGLVASLHFKLPAGPIICQQLGPFFPLLSGDSGESEVDLVYASNVHRK